jgi:hypothetical protein
LVGWLESFRTRHSIDFISVCGESADVCEETLAEWHEKLCALMDGYKPKDTANYDETDYIFKHCQTKLSV